MAILASPEYFQIRGGGTNAGFVQALYLDVLKRPADQAGLQGFTQALAAGVTRQQVAQIIVDSPEGITVDVQGLYNQLLHRNADAGGLSTFVTALEQNDPPSNPNMFPNDPPANATGSYSFNHP